MLWRSVFFTSVTLAACRSNAVQEQVTRLPREESNDTTPANQKVALGLEIGRFAVDVGSSRELKQADVDIMQRKSDPRDQGVL